MSAGSPVIFWYRQDLRVADHRPLRAAVESGAPVLAVSFLEPRWFDATPVAVPRLGPFRSAFIAESLRSLDEALRARGGALWVERAASAEALVRLVRKLGVREVVAHREVGFEERQDEALVAEALEREGARLRLFGGQALVEQEALPFSVDELPDVFTTFRKRVERSWTVPAPLPAPERLHGFRGEMPSLEGAVGSLAMTSASSPVDPRALLRFAGGIGPAHERLRHWMWGADALRDYKQTRNGMLEPDDSSKLSPWVAHGCLSPREVYAEVLRYERERVANESTYWMVFELLWRDYFRWAALKAGPRLFATSGPAGRARSWRHDRRLFDRWARGDTGIPLVDASMRELRTTGFMSNRGRQNVVSLLTKDLGVDWRWGAWWFESWLVDYDVASNWGNWAYGAGVGQDPRDRRFDPVGQGRRYDPDGDYARRWLPELQGVAAEAIYEVRPGSVRLARPRRAPGRPRRRGERR